MKKNKINQNKKNAFTIAETLMVLVLIGIVSLSAVQANRHIEEKIYPKLYIKAYTTLQTASYNIQQEVAEHNKKENMAARENGLSSASNTKLKKFPNVKQTETPTSTMLCNGLKNYINRATPNCASILSVNTSQLPAKYSIQSNPTFVASDGMKYFITNLGSGQNSHNFFLVFVDLNGDRRPNSIVHNGKQKPDIVPFFIHKTTGDVVPAGYPTDDFTYLQARVLYSSPDKDIDYSIPMTYNLAKKVAYNNKNYRQDPMSATTTGTTNIVNYFVNTYPKKFTKPTSVPSGVAACSQTGYDSAKDFPPCKVEVNTRI